MKINNVSVERSKYATAPMRIASHAPSTLKGPSENDIRAYAYHLYEESNEAPGNDLDNWFEATARLNAGIPADRTCERLHRLHDQPIAQPVATHHR